MSRTACVEAPTEIPEGIKNKVFVDPKPFEPGFTGQTHTIPLGKDYQLLLTIYLARTTLIQTYNEENILMTEPPVDLSYRATTILERVVNQKTPDRFYSIFEAYEMAAEKIRVAAQKLGPIDYRFCETDPNLCKGGFAAFKWEKKEIIMEEETFVARRIFEHQDLSKSMQMPQSLPSDSLQGKAA